MDELGRPNTRRTPLSGRDTSASLLNKSFNPGLISAASRPVTQQGMTGLRPPQTASGLNRQYHDKRYYVSQIQNHMLTINEEINNLKKKLVENKLDATNYEECKRQVEDLSKQLSGHEESLITYNTAIEISMFKGSKNDIDTDAEKLRRANQQKINQLESIFSNKMAREEQLNKLQQQLEVETQLFNDVLATFSEEKRQEYDELWQTNEKYKKDEEDIGNEIKNLRIAINLHEQHVVQNEKKRVRYNLMVKLHEVSRRKDKILEENKIKRSPSQEREYLLEQVKQDRTDMDSFKTQQEELKTELEKLQERYGELEDELSEKNSARLNKYRELLKREETMESFLENYVGAYDEAITTLNELRTQVVFALEYISGNAADNFNMEDIDKVPAYTLNSNLSKEELKTEFQKLTSQLNMYVSVKSRFDNELKSLKETQTKYLEDLETYNKIDDSRENLVEHQQSLETKKGSLKGVLSATRSAVVEAEKKKQEIETQLKFNDTYKAVHDLESRLTELQTENEKQRAAVQNIKMMDDFEKFKTESFVYVKDILEQIQRASKTKL